MKALTFGFPKYVPNFASPHPFYTDLIYVNYLLIVHKAMVKKWPYV